jgi:serine/threonine protein kinase
MSAHELRQKLAEIARRNREGEDTAPRFGSGVIAKELASLEDVIEESQFTDETGSVNLKKGRYKLGSSVYPEKTPDGQEAMVKEIRIPENIHPEDEAKELRRIIDQIRIGDVLDHPHHVKLLHYDEPKDNVHRLFYTVADGDRLDDILKRRNLKTDEILTIAEHVARALSYSHDDFSPPIIHGDLSPGNVMYDEKENRAKVIDHGSSIDSILDDSSYTTRLFTPGFGAPELGLGEAYPRSDVFGLGVLIAYMITKKEPKKFFNHRNELKYEELVGLVKKGTTDADLIDLVKDMTEADYTLRPTARQVYDRIQVIKSARTGEEEVLDLTKGVSKLVDKAREAGFNVITEDLDSGFSNDNDVMITGRYVRDEEVAYTNPREALTCALEAAIAETPPPIPECEKDICGYSKQKLKMIYGSVLNHGHHVACTNSELSQYYDKNPSLMRLIELSNEGCLEIDYITSVFDSLRKHSLEGRSDFFDREQYKKDLKKLRSGKFESLRKSLGDDKETTLTMQLIKEGLKHRVGVSNVRNEDYFHLYDVTSHDPAFKAPLFWGAGIGTVFGFVGFGIGVGISTMTGNEAYMYVAPAAFGAGGFVGPFLRNHRKKKLTGGDVSATIDRHYAPQKVLEKVCEVMEVMPSVERGFLASKIAKVGQELEGKVSPYDILDIIKQRYPEDSEIQEALAEHGLPDTDELDQEAYTAAQTEVGEVEGPDFELEAPKYEIVEESYSSSGKVMNKLRETVFGIVASFGVLYGYREKAIERDFQKKEEQIRVTSNNCEEEREDTGETERTSHGLGKMLYRPMSPRPEKKSTYIYSGKDSDTEEIFKNLKIVSGENSALNDFVEMPDKSDLYENIITLYNYNK